jgi:type IV pilus modification protein PilV
MAMLESLVAMLILTAGVLSLLWMHQRALVMQRQQIYRDQAMHVADNLQQRMLINAAHASGYVRAWGAPSGPAVFDCATSTCDRAQLSEWDLQQAHTALKHLPQGDISIAPLQTGTGWWAITVAWRDTDETFRINATSDRPACPIEKSCWRLVFSLA